MNMRGLSINLIVLTNCSLSTNFSIQSCIVYFPFLFLPELSLSLSFSFSSLFVSFSFSSGLSTFSLSTRSRSNCGREIEYCKCVSEREEEYFLEFVYVCERVRGRVCFCNCLCVRVCVCVFVCVHVSVYHLFTHQIFSV